MQSSQRDADHDKSHQYISLQELFDAYGFHRKCHFEEISTGAPVGNEKLDDYEQT